MDKNPFSAGRWVYGVDFFGRRELIQSLLDPDESCNWVIGTRRIGKTSLLRQLEYVANRRPEIFALYWDIQGSYDSSGLFDHLLDALEDSRDTNPETWNDFEFEPDEDSDCPHVLKQLARALNRAGRRLILLIDEGEELINVGKQDPVLLSKLRRFFQSTRNTQTVIASTPRLETLYKTMEMETSPFLHGFTVSYLGNLNAEDGQALLARGFDSGAVRDRL